MAVKSAVLSVDEFARLPRPAGGVRQELHHGALVELPPVKKLHMKLQKRLVSLLEVRLAPAEYRVDKGVSVSSLPRIRGLGRGRRGHRYRSPVAL
jgi:Uma2 family endonuclease